MKKLAGIIAVLIVGVTVALAEDTILAFDAWETNALAKVDIIDFIIENDDLTNVVKRLAEEGHVCAVYGHSYEYTGTIYTSYPAQQEKRCRICGDISSDSMGIMYVSTNWITNSYVINPVQGVKDDANTINTR